MVAWLEYAMRHWGLCCRINSGNTFNLEETDCLDICHGIVASHFLCMAHWCQYVLSNDIWQRGVMWMFGGIDTFHSHGFIRKKCGAVVSCPSTLCESCNR